MCEFAWQLNSVLKSLQELGEPFDVLQVRDALRDLCGDLVQVNFQPVKFELLAAFERGALPGWIIGTKQIEESKTVENPHYEEGSGLSQDATLVYNRSVLEFRPDLTDPRNWEKPDDEEFTHPDQFPSSPLNEAEEDEIESITPWSVQSPRVAPPKIPKMPW